MLIQDTRPISVTNCDNRLVVKALAQAITPALQALITMEQLGFVPGRVGTDHVHGLLNSFYAHLSAKAQQFILLLDTARAFDSVSHAFIKATLNRIGMPLWVQEAVRHIRGLLHDVRVTPCLTGLHTELWIIIAICRGVKQGCPISPLLFVLCFEVLLHRLRQVDRCKRYAFADDLAISTARVPGQGDLPDPGP
jgi:hypothetical protein